jgi:hypothetical protein
VRLWMFDRPIWQDRPSITFHFANRLKETNYIDN